MSVMADLGNFAFTVVRLPRPDGVDTQGDPLWWLNRDDGAAVIAYADPQEGAMVRLPDGEDAMAEEVERYAAVLLSGVRESRRLAAEFAQGGEPKC